MSDADKIKKCMILTKIIAETVQETGEAPLGHLYSALMNHCDITTFNTMIGVLESSGLISVASNCATWTGPKIEKAVK